MKNKLRMERKITKKKKSKLRVFAENFKKDNYVFDLDEDTVIYHFNINKSYKVEINLNEDDDEEGGDE